VAGAAAGLVAALFQWIVTEDQIRKALKLEEAANAGEVHDDMFTRTTQVAGGMLAAILYGLCIGVVFAVVLAMLWHTIPGRTAFHRSIRLAAVAYVAWVLVPGLKYPPNPPAVGDPDTIGQRTTAYVCLMLASIVVTYLCWVLWQRIGERRSERGGDDPNPGLRFAVVAAVYVGLVALLYVVFPANPDALDAPANLIWHFRLDSFAGNALLFLVIGTVFGILGDAVRLRSETPRPDRITIDA
jgi:hypothetical protein